MTNLIISAFFVSVAYFLFAFVARMYDCLITRYNRHTIADIAKPIAPVKIARKLSDLIRSEWQEQSPKENDLDDAKFEPAIESVEDIEANPAQNLPTTIRAIREYIRANALQAHVKEVCGKSVAKCSLAELKAAIA